MKNSNRFAKVAIAMMFFELFIKAAGFIKQAVIAYYFGASASMDIYFLASDFINGLSNAVINSARIAVIGVFTYSRHQRGRDYANSLMNQTIEVTALISMCVCAIVAFGSDLISRLLAPSYDAGLHNELSVYVRLFSGILFFTSICMAYDSLLNSYERFFVTKTRTLIYSLVVVLACVLFSNKYGSNALVVAQYLTLVIYLVVQVISSKNTYVFNAEPLSKKADLKRIILSMMPVLISNSMVYINYQVDNSIATGLGNSSVSALAYSHTLDDFFMGVLIVSLASILFPHMANLIAEGKKEEGILTLRRSVLVMVMLLLPVSIIAFITNLDLVSIVYKRGKFDEYTALMTSIVLSGYVIRYPFVCIRDLCNQGLFAFSDTKKPMINSLIATVVNILFSVILSIKYGIIGISLGTTISVVLCSILNVMSLSKYTHENLLSDNHAFFFRLLLCGGGTFFGVYILDSYLELHNALIRLMILSFVCLIVYFGALFIVKEPNVLYVYNKAKKILHKRSVESDNI